MRRALILAIVLAAGCRGISPNPAPLSPSAPSPAVTPTRLLLVVSPGELPVGGGTARIYIESMAGTSMAPRVPVTLTASGGTLDVSQVTTDHTGHAMVPWTGTATARITATGAGLETSMDLRVLAPPTFAPPSTPPPPRPTPPPPPPAPPAPTPIVVTLQADAPAGTAQVDATKRYTATVSNLQPGESVAFYEWNLDGDKDFEATTTESFRVSEKYTQHGVIEARVTVTSTRGRSASGSTRVIVTN